MDFGGSGEVNAKSHQMLENSSPSGQTSEINSDGTICHFIEKSTDVDVTFLKGLWQEKCENSNLTSSTTTTRPHAHEEDRNAVDQRVLTPTEKSNQTSRKRNQTSPFCLSFPTYFTDKERRCFPPDLSDDDDYSDDDENKIENDIYGLNSGGNEGNSFLFTCTRYQSVRMYDFRNERNLDDASNTENSNVQGPRMYLFSQNLVFLKSRGDQVFRSPDCMGERRSLMQSHISGDTDGDQMNNFDSSKANQSENVNIEKPNIPRKTFDQTKRHGSRNIPSIRDAGTFSFIFGVTRGTEEVPISTNTTLSDSRNKTSASPTPSLIQPLCPHDGVKTKTEENNHAQIRKNGSCHTDTYDSEYYSDSDEHGSKASVFTSTEKSTKNKTEECDNMFNPSSHESRSIDMNYVGRDTPDLENKLSNVSTEGRTNMNNISTKGRNILSNAKTDCRNELSYGNTEDVPEQSDASTEGHRFHCHCHHRQFDNANIFQSQKNHVHAYDDDVEGHHAYYQQDDLDYPTGQTYSHGHYQPYTERKGNSVPDVLYNFKKNESFSSKSSSSTEDQTRSAVSALEMFPCLRERYSRQGCGNCRNCRSNRTMEMMQALADSIDREIHDVLPDGNCMFRSIIDQLRMQGELDWTSMSLRTQSVEYLRGNPNQEDGTSLAEFLTVDGDTWDEYLHRMSKDAEWGDNIILRGLAEVIGRKICIISAFGDLHNQTTVAPSEKKETDQLEDIFLGHIDDQHYVSLRKKDWRDSWYRNAYKNDIKNNTRRIYESDGIEKYLKCNTFNSAVDKYSNIPQCHLSFVIRRVIPEKVIKTLPREFLEEMLSQMSRNGANVILYGSEADGLAASYISRPMLSTMNKYEEKKTEIPHCAFFNNDVQLVENRETCSANAIKQMEMHYVGLHPGYLRLHCPSFANIYPNQVKRVNNNFYLLNEQYKNKKRVNLIYAFKCKQWPAFITSSWKDRKRPSGWPNEDLSKKILSTYLTITPFSHQESKDRDIEWQFCFAKQEYILALSLNKYQKYCFHIFQLLLRFHVGEHSLKRYLLKNIFFHALENISVEHWNMNLGACILYLIDQTIEAVNTKSLPHYFIQGNNLLATISDTYCQNLSTKLHAIRVFPLMSIILLAEGHGLTTSGVADLVIEDIPKFQQHNDAQISALDVYVPSYIKEIQNEIHLASFRSAADTFTEAYEEITRESSPSILSCKNFLQQTLCGVSFSDQWWFCFFLDFFHKKAAIHHMFQHQEGLLLCELIGQPEDAGIFSCIKIPLNLIKDINKSSLHGDQSPSSTYIGFLFTLCSELTKERLYDLSVFYLRILIRRIKGNIGHYSREHENAESMTESNIVTDSDLMYTSLTKVRKENSYLKEMTVNFLNMHLYYTYIMLFNTYQYLSQPELFSEYVLDLESVCDTIATKGSYKQLANIWWILGSSEKYSETMQKYSNLTTSEHHHNK